MWGGGREREWGEEGKRDRESHTIRVQCKQYSVPATYDVDQLKTVALTTAHYFGLVSSYPARISEQDEVLDWGWGVWGSGTTHH